MLIRDFFNNLRRRWYLVVTGIVVTAALCVGAYIAVPANYETKASLLLLPPKSSVGARGNPFLYLDGLNQALDVVSTRLNSVEITKPIAEKYPGLSLEIARDATTSGPILVVDAVDTHEAPPQEVVQGLVNQVPTVLQSLQDNLQIPTNSRITVMVLNLDPTPKVDLKNKLRAVIALAAVGLGGTVVLTGLVDSLLSRRRRRGAGSAAKAERTPAASARTSEPASVADEAPSADRELVGAGRSAGGSAARSPQTPSRSRSANRRDT